MGALPCGTPPPCGGRRHLLPAEHARFWWMEEVEELAEADNDEARTGYTGEEGRGKIVFLSGFSL